MRFNRWFDPGTRRRIAPGVRGLTTGWDGDYDGDVASFRILNLVRDAIGLVFALGYRQIAAVIGHDFGSPVAAWCALVRPDVFPAVALMSAPFAGAPALPFGSAARHAASTLTGVLRRPSGANDALAALPRPRKHYQWYYATPRSGRGHAALPAGRSRVLARVLPR